ncbi:MAG: ornithine carbamoyltransferase [Deltaproteobacteria bacterium]|nr:ornithine carbamoyltransferase [Deltaproteobacteria bacterium]
MDNNTSDIKGRSVICLKDFSRDEISLILDTAVRLKKEWKEKHSHGAPLAGKSMAMIFQKPSLRTRVSFELAMQQLGGYAFYLSPNEIKLGQRETTEDIAKVLGRYVDVLMARTFSHSDVEELARYAGIPVVNGLTGFNHPCQILADLMTIREKKGRLEGIRVTYLGDGSNNVATSLAFGCAGTGAHLTISSSERRRLGRGVQEDVAAIANKTGSQITYETDPSLAVQGADVVYTDVWTSMGQEAERAERIKELSAYTLGLELFSKAKPDAIAMHCLPAHYGEEITHDVTAHERSAVFDQAENRLHAQKAVLYLILRD